MVRNINKHGRCVNDPSTLEQQIDLSICNPGVKPKDDQVEIINLAINTNRAALFLGLGYGKTFIGGYTAWHTMCKSVLAGHPKKRRYLIVAPKSAIGEWATQLPKFFPCKVHIFPENPSLDCDFIVTNFEHIDKFIPYAEWIGGLIVDESQGIKNMETLRFKNLMAACDGEIMCRFILTATPISNNPDDVFSQLSFINPYAFNFSYDFMKSRYFFKRGVGRERVKQGALPVFAHIIECNAVLAKTDESSKPGVDRVTEAVQLCPDQQKLMEAVGEGHIRLITKTEVTGAESKKNELVELKNSLMKECQVSSGFLMAGDNIIRVPSPKLARAYDIAKNQWGDEQVIIWVYFRETAQRMFEAFKHEAVQIVGGMSTKARMAARDTFVSGKKRVAILQLNSANSALNLQNCSKAVFVEYDWPYIVVDQAVGRIDRPGQQTRCEAIMLYTDMTGDVVVFESCVNKLNVTSSVLKNFVSTRSLPKISGTKSAIKPKKTHKQPVYSKGW